MKLDGKRRQWYWYDSISWTRILTTPSLATHIRATIVCFIILNTKLICAADKINKGYIRIADGNIVSKDAVEQSLQIVHDIATENLGTLCVSKSYRPLQVPLNTERYESVRQKADLAAVVLQEVGVNRHIGLPDALCKGLLLDEHVAGARILTINVTNGYVGSSVWWVRNEGATNSGSIAEPIRNEDDGIQVGTKPSTNYPWFEDELSSTELRSPKFASSPPNVSFKGWWTYPYYSCSQRKWILSYSVAIPPLGKPDIRQGMRGFLSIDIDVTNLWINQCEASSNSRIIPSAAYLQGLSYINRFYQPSGAAAGKLFLQTDLTRTVFGIDPGSQIEAFQGSNKCHRDSMTCEFRVTPTTTAPLMLTGLNAGGKIVGAAAAPASSAAITNSWQRGAYQCMCKNGFYSLRDPHGFNGTIMEVAYQEYRDNISNYYLDVFKCIPCAPGCGACSSPAPCLANYNWPFRISLLIISVCCAVSTIMLAAYMFHHRKIKVFKVASPIFLSITLIGCAIMYLEMAAIFPILDTYSCIATKWTRHMGFCITYTSLLMKTWRVSLTYRVKSAHKVKLTDKQLLQWMVPILLVMLIYLGTWTLSAPPNAEIIRDQYGLKFKICSYTWWDHSLAIGEVLFLAWGIRVCYNVRNAESLYNEARLISYAIYNIAVVNCTMVAFHLLIFPQAGPDIKYLLGFIRTQLSTSTTIALVFGPKVLRVLRGQGDQWDQKARVRGITASFSLNGVGLVPEDSPDLYQENEELKEEIQKLAAQIEFMKIVHMEVNNRHLKPRPGGYFTIVSSSFPNPFVKSSSSSAQTQTQASAAATANKASSQQNSVIISEDGHSGTNSLGNNSMGYQPQLQQIPTGATQPSQLQINGNNEKV